MVVVSDIKNIKEKIVSAGRRNQHARSEPDWHCPRYPEGDSRAHRSEIITTRMGKTRVTAVRGLVVFEWLRGRSREELADFFVGGLGKIFVVLTDAHE